MFNTDHHDEEDAYVFEKFRTLVAHHMTHVKTEQRHNTYPYTTVAFPTQVHRENKSGNLTGFINTKLSHELTHVTKKKNST